MAFKQCLDRSGQSRSASSSITLSYRLQYQIEDTDSARLWGRTSSSYRHFLAEPTSSPFRHGDFPAFTITIDPEIVSRIIYLDVISHKSMLYPILVKDATYFPSLKMLISSQND